jgi:transposase
VRPGGVLPTLPCDAAQARSITSKYLDSVPLYRPAALLGRFGGTGLSRNALAASVVCLSQAVQPLHLSRLHGLAARWLASMAR